METNNDKQVSAATSRLTNAASAFPAAPKLLIVILNWNGYTYTVECLAKLWQQTNQNFDVLVVDNGSTDGSVERLAPERNERCQLIALKRNLGFVGGMNCGLRQALAKDYKYVWILNNDAFPDPCCLDHLIAAMEDNPQSGAVTPLLYEQNQTEQHAGGRIDWATGCHEVLFAQQMIQVPDRDYWLTGTALLLRVDALRRVGLFDPMFFAYWEDVDLCIRLSKAGYRLQAIPSARCLHLGSSSTGGAESCFVLYMQTRNAYLFLSKHLRGARRLRTLSTLLANVLKRAASLSNRGMDAQASASIAAMLAALSRSTGPPGPLRTSVLIRRCVLWKWWRTVQVLEFVASLLGRSA